MNGGSVIFNFKGDTKDVQDKTKNLEKEITSSFSNVTKLVKGGLITKAITKGMSVISSSVDSAISRLDTMNNFPKVMSNLGQSAEDSAEVIQYLSDKLTGLPTALNDGVSAVQRFTSKNGDVKKSADIFLAVNNAILAGGASMEIQSSALEQLSQAYAKGKPDMMEWRSLLTAMPAQINQVAQAMGMSADELGEGLREGNISMDEFIDKIMELNRTGVGEFASFEEQARNSTGGIATNITNLKTAVTRGVANVIGAFDTMMANNNLPTFSELVSLATQKINEAFKKVVDFMKNVDLQPFINAITKIWSLFKKLAPVILVTTTAFKAYGAVMKVLAFANILSKVLGFVKAFTSLIPLVKGVKDAFMLLNVAFGLSPIGLVIAGITALVAGFILLWNKCEGFRNFWINLWNKMKEVFSTVVGFIKKNWKSLLLVLVNPFVGAFKLLYDNCDGFRNFINNFVNSIKNFFTKTIPEAINNFLNFISGIPAKVINFLSQIPYYIGYAIGYVAGLIVKGAMTVWSFLTVTIPQIINNIIEWVSSLPGKIWEFLQTIWQHITEIATNVWNWVTVDLPQIIQNVINWFASLPGKIWEALVNAYNKISTWVSNTWNKMVNGAKDIVNAVIKWFKELPSNMANIGHNIVTGIWNGIKNAKDWLLGKIKDFSSGIMDGFKKALGIHSPSKITAEMGVNLDKGFINGMEDMQPDIQKTIDGMFDLSPNLYGNTSTNLSPQINVVNNVNMKQDPLGQMVNDIKTFAGGSKNDYNYGMGV